MRLLRHLQCGAHFLPVFPQRLAEVRLVLLGGVGHEALHVGVQLGLVILVGLGPDVGQLRFGILVEPQLRGLGLGRQAVLDHVGDGLLDGRGRGDQLRGGVALRVHLQLAAVHLATVEHEGHGVVRPGGQRARAQRQRQQPDHESGLQSTLHRSFLQAFNDVNRMYHSTAARQSQAGKRASDAEKHAVSPRRFIEHRIKKPVFGSG